MVVTESSAVRVLEETYHAFRQQALVSRRPAIDRAMCSAAVWLALYISRLLGWDDLENDFHDLALKVDARVRAEGA